MDIRTLIVGLTGGIASGKSTVASRFETLGVPVIDTDRIARDLTVPGTEATMEIIATFGKESVNEKGELRRDWLRSRLFHDDVARRELEHILHPLIRRETLAQLEQVTAPYAVVVVPLLFESGFDDVVDRTLVVDTDPESQVRRLMQRDGASERDAHAALAAQLPRAERLERADDVIDNLGQLSALDAQVDSLHLRYLKLGKAKNASE